MGKKKIEKGIIADLSDLSAVKNMSGLYNLAYIGSEFCQNILPELSQIENLYLYGFKKVVLLTSFMSTSALDKNKRKISEIIYNFPDIEIIINDLGLLSYLNKTNKKIVKGIGRPLSIEFIRMDLDELSKFMNKYNISILETDELDMLKNIPSKRDFLISFHSPLKFVALNRYCSYTRKLSQHCDFQCFKEVKKIKIPKSSEYLFCFQNAYLTEKKSVSDGPFDRLVKNSFYKKYVL